MGGLSIRGDSVLLRAMTREDVPRQAEFFQNAELAWLDSSDPETYAAMDVEEFFKARTGANPALAAFAIEVDGKYVGYCSLMKLTDPRKSFELGIVIGDPDYWGRELGREALALLLRYAFDELGARRIYLTTHERNERAVRCYLACGFVEEGRPRKAGFCKGEYIDLIEMSILREEWTLIRPLPRRTRADAATRYAR